MSDIISSVSELISNILHSPILQSNLLNFLIMVFILYKLSAPFIRKAIEQSAENTKRTVENSDLNKKQAETNRDIAKEEYEKTPQEIDYINQTAKETLSSLEKKAEEDTEKTKNSISSNAERALLNESARVISTLTEETAKQSLITAREKIITELRENENLHDILIEQSIDELELTR